MLFIILYDVILTFESVNKTLKCDCSNESYGTRFFVIRCVIKTGNLHTLNTKPAACTNGFTRKTLPTATPSVQVFVV